MHQFRHGVRRERRQPGRDQSRRGADAPRGSGRGELMRHRARGTQLSRTASHKRATLANLATSLLEHDRIVTTEAKAKELRPYVERLITLARRGGLHARRQVERRIKSREVSGRLFKELGPRFAARPGGYTRIVKIGHRSGDGAEMARIELVAEGRGSGLPKRRRGPEGPRFYCPTWARAAGPVPGARCRVAKRTPSERDGALSEPGWTWYTG